MEGFYVDKLFLCCNKNKKTPNKTMNPPISCDRLSVSFNIKNARKLAPTGSPSILIDIVELLT